MPTLFFANFEFEHCLRGGGDRPVPAAVRRLTEELATVWIAVAAPGDVLWLRTPLEPGFLDEMAAAGLSSVRCVSDPAQVRAGVELCPWGWTDALRTWGEGHGWLCAAPPQSVVRAANSRRFSAGLESEWGIAPPGAATVSSLKELAAAVERLPAGFRRWMVKAEYGMSARERALGRGHDLPPNVARWAARRLEADGVLFLEPWLDRVEEAGVQLTLPRDGGPPRLEGITPLLTDRSGTYRGSRFSPDSRLEETWAPAIEAATRAASVLARRGYHGPLGVDAMRYRAPDGTHRLRPLQDVNARWTMGRLSLGFRALLEAEEEGWWLHLPCVPQSRRGEETRAGKASGTQGHAQTWDRLACRFPPDARIIRTSPLEAGVSLVTCLVIVASGAEAPEFLSGVELPPR